MGSGLGFLAATTSPASPAPAVPQLTVQQLLNQIGQGSLANNWCDCSSSKYCSSSTGGCPSNQYSGCSYWGGSVAQRLLCWPVPGPWTAGASNTLAKVGGLVSEGGGVTASLTSGAAPIIAAGSVVPVVGTIVAALAATITSLFSAAHAAAQRAQANAIAQGVPGANQLLQQIDSELASGTITPAQAQQLYSQIQTSFSNLMRQGTSYKSGDALWICDIAMQLVIAARNADLKAGVLTGGAPGPWTSAGSNPVSAALANLGISSDWLPWVVIGGAAIGAALFM